MQYHVINHIFNYDVYIKHTILKLNLDTRWNCKYPSLVENDWFAEIAYYWRDSNAGIPIHNIHFMVTEIVSFPSKYCIYNLLLFSITQNYIFSYK